MFETTVVACATPFHRICVPLTKLEPVAVSVNPGLPAITVAGRYCAERGRNDALEPTASCSEHQENQHPEVTQSETLSFSKSAFPENIWFVQQRIQP